MHFVFHAGTSPALLLLHGTGGNENDLIPLGQTLRPGGALLSPRGEVNENGQLRFFRRLPPGIFDEDDLIRRTHALADFVEAECSVRAIGKPVAVGYSNGANIAAAMLLLRPGVLGGAVLFRAMVPLEPSPLPALPGTPVLLLAGRHDPMIPEESTRRLAIVLGEAGAEVSLEWHGAGHGLVQPEFLHARKWLQERFPG